MIKSVFKKIVLISLLSFFLVSPVWAGANVFSLVDKVGSGAEYGASKEPEEVVAMVIQAVLGFLGIIFVVLMIIGGIQWMTAEGNEESVKKAKNRIKNAVIGLVIVVLSYAISVFVISTLLKNNIK
ncbi:MAG: Mbov_0395 family pilin-like conjugal transfer protein [Patescibacteria group bacterium]|jgi:type IV secretory pathway VirB2 component (pilin)|nr:hypothetical protein [Patescibacteria group bacterium]